MLHFYQGKESLLKDDSEERQIATVKAKIAGFFDMKNVCFLFGSGTSTNAIPKMSVLMDRVKKALLGKLNDKQKESFENVTKKNNNNLETVLGVLYSKKAYLEGIELSDKGEERLKNTDDLIKKIEEAIFGCLNVNSTDDEYEKVLGIYQKFYKRMALRNKDHSRICVFTTNNDLFNERALDSQNIHYINGFTGGLNRFFNPALFNYSMSKRMDTSIDKFEPIENLIYLYKIHGSINWIEDKELNSNTYFKIRELVEPNFEANNVLIYPTPLKQNKSLGSPYVDLFREFQHKMLEPNTVLFVIGYSFSDEHVNDIIYRALATNSTMNLVIFGNLKEDKEITQISDNRIFRLFETEPEEGKVPLHYFERVVEEILPDLDAFKQEDALLHKFINELDSSRKTKQDEDR